MGGVNSWKSVLTQGEMGGHIMKGLLFVIFVSPSVPFPLPF